MAVSESAVAETIRHDELVAFFQPIVDLRTGSIIAIEARVRRTSGGAIAGPREVLALVRSTRSEEILDQAVLKRAAEARPSLRRYLIPAIRIAVNLTASGGRLQALAENIDTILVADGLLPTVVRLELPVKALQPVTEVTLNVLRRLRDRGYEITADHVAWPEEVTRTLPGFPFSSLKLDEQLVQEAMTSAEAATRVRGICSAARAVGLAAGAEGIHRLEQIEFLVDAGCHEGQGPLISPARPLEDIIYLLYLLYLLKRGRCW